MGDQCSQARIKQGNPKQKAWQDDVGARHDEGSRQAPQYDGERDERGDRRDQKDRKIVDAVAGSGAVRATIDKTIDVFSDALIWIVGLAGDKADPIMVVAR